MKYKIIKRIQSGRTVVGYQLLTEDGKILNASKKDVIQVASNGMVVNATYNNKTECLSGVGNFDLRGLPVVQYNTLNNKVEDNGNKASKLNTDKD